MRIASSMIALFSSIGLLFCVAMPLAQAEEHGAKKEHEGAEAEAEPKLLGPSGVYVHKWLKFPSIAGATLPHADEQTTVAAKPGRMTIVLFLASWCEPCQQLVPRFRMLEKRYQRLPVDFHYVFVHDTLDDATGFMKEFGIKEAVLGNTDILKTFHNPDLPSFYTGDRHGWLMARSIKAGPDAVDNLEETLKYLAAY